MRELVQRPKGAGAENGIMQREGTAGTAGEGEADGAEDSDDDSGVVQDVWGSVVFVWVAYGIGFGIGIRVWRCCWGLGGRRLGL